MRIGVISDTHIPHRRKELPAFVRQAFAGSDLILHCGDINDWSVLRELNRIAPTEAVAGNTDPDAMSDILGCRLQLELDGYRIGVTHGHLGTGRNTPERAYNTFPKADVVLFGHSHQPFNRVHKGCLLLNPGSPTDKRREKHFSVAILTLGAKLEAELIYFD